MDDKSTLFLSNMDDKRLKQTSYRHNFLLQKKGISSMPVKLSVLQRFVSYVLSSLTIFSDEYPPPKINSLYKSGERDIKTFFRSAIALKADLKIFIHAIIAFEAALKF
jgi:hypothetical protein